MNFMRILIGLLERSLDQSSDPYHKLVYVSGILLLLRVGKEQDGAGVYV